MEESDDKNVEDERVKSRRRKKKLYKQLLKQMEFYFGDVNLSKDRFLSQLLAKDKKIPLAVFLSFNRVKTMTTDMQDLVNALKQSDMLKVTEDGLKVYRITPVQRKENENDCTIYVEQLPPDATHDWVKNVFSAYGTVDYVSIPKYKNKQAIKGFAFVEFSTPEEAQKALEAFGAAGCCLTAQMLPEELCSIATYEAEEHEAQGEGRKIKEEEDVISSSNEAGVLEVKEEAEEADAAAERKKKKGKRKRSEEMEASVVDEGKERKKIKVEVEDEEEDQREEEEEVVRRKKKKRNKEGQLEEEEEAAVEEEETHKKKKKKKKENGEDVEHREAEKAESDEELEEEKQRKKKKVAEEDEEVTAGNGESEHSEDEEELEENNEEGKKKMKRKRKRKKKEEPTTLGLRIMSKVEWIRLRSKYLNLQREKLGGLKRMRQENLNAVKKRMRQSQWGSNYLSPARENNVHETVEKKNHHTTPTEFIPGIIVHVDLPEPVSNVREFQRMVKSHEDIAYVDAQEGSTEMFLRLVSAPAAQKLLTDRPWERMSLLEGKEERKYWGKILEKRKEIMENTKLKGDKKMKMRGRNKLLRQAESELGKHIKFEGGDE